MFEILVHNGERYILLPDPIKLLTKLGRHDLVDWDHAEEYRISLLDLTQDYRDIRLHDQLTLAVEERYRCSIGNITPMLTAICAHLST